MLHALEYKILIKYVLLFVIIAYKIAYYKLYTKLHITYYKIVIKYVFLFVRITYSYFLMKVTEITHRITRIVQDKSPHFSLSPCVVETPWYSYSSCYSKVVGII